MERLIASHDTIPRANIYARRYPAWLLAVLSERRCPGCARPMGEDATERFLHEGCEREGAA